MVQLSRRKVEDDVLEKLFTLFFEIVGKNKVREDFENIIQGVLSTTEKIMIAKRIAIFYLLIKKIDYIIICETLKVSAATVFKFRFILENNQTVSLSYEKIVRNEKIFNFLEEVYLTLRGPGVPGVNWSEAWKHKRRFERRKTRGI